MVRDELLKKWVFVEGGVKVPEDGFGSGYPGGLNRFFVFTSHEFCIKLVIRYRSQHKKVFEVFSGFSFWLLFFGSI